MATKNTAEKQETQAQASAGYTKAQILASARYADRKDVLGALLEDGGKYSLEQVNKLLDGFMKGKVK